ncbi:MAG: hypothetical protein WKF58_05395 [Ilumatobacteraceae bacterium]
MLIISTQNTDSTPSLVSPPIGQNQRDSVVSPVPCSNDAGSPAVPRCNSVKQSPSCSRAVL